MKIETLKTREIDSLTRELRSNLEKTKKILDQIVAKQKMGGACEKDFFHEMVVESQEIRALLEHIEEKGLDAKTVSKAFTGGN